MARAVLVLAFLPAIHAQDFQSKVHSFKLETVVEGLQSPWGLVQLPDGRFLVTERGGRLRVVENGKLLAEPVSGLPEVFFRGQGGLLDIELHPDYAQNGWIYLAYSKPGPGGAATSIIRGRVKENKWVDQEIVFDPPAEDYRKGGNHFGCRIEFDKNGFLFFGVGDRGDVTTPENQAQKLNTMNGKIHRLHDDGKIPTDNPFVHIPGARPSIWCYGNRNPQGLKFQPETGVLWETEHGPQGGDELNIIKKGLNYGWPIVTFGKNYSGTPISDKTHLDGMEDPVTHWTPSIAVCGMDFYSGASFPGWKGNLLVGSLAHTKLVRLQIEADKVVEEEIVLQNQGRIREVRCLADGFVYLVLDSGRISRLVPGA